MTGLRNPRQLGVALITAVLIVAIVSTVAAYLGLGQQVRLRPLRLHVFDAPAAAAAAAVAA